jgi:N-acetylglucosaminyldiphosphoundecaprenol N-acetyl-beta-D-mannosaminyltransferase
MVHMNILDVRVDPITKDEAIAKIAIFLDEPKQHFVTTPNPEIILYAHKHPTYRDILNKADMALPDGAGLVFASRIQNQPLPERVSGTDMVPEIAKLASERGLKIALIGGLNEDVIHRAATVMLEQGRNVVYAEHGVSAEHWNDRLFHEKMVKELNDADAQVVFAAFGHPKQEQWIDEYRAALPLVRLFMGCGGALDFIAGAAKRAPSWMRRAGLEWLWRLITEPKRFKRIFNAVIVFPLTVIYGTIWKK